MGLVLAFAGLRCLPPIPPTRAPSIPKQGRVALGHVKVPQGGSAGNSSSYLEALDCSGSASATPSPRCLRATAIPLGSKRQGDVFPLPGLSAPRCADPPPGAHANKLVSAWRGWAAYGAVAAWRPSPPRARPNAAQRSVMQMVMHGIGRQS